MLMTDQQAWELAKPGVGSFDDPTPLVAAQFAPIFVTPLLIVLPVRHDQLDAAFLQSLAQRIRIAGGVGNHPFRLLSRTAFGLRNRDFLERGFRKRNRVRRGTFQPNSQRKTLTVDQYHPLCPLAPLGFSDGRAPFFAGAKLPSRKVSSHFSRPSLSSAPSRVRHAFSQTPSSSHGLSRRQPVEGEGNSSGKNRHAAPVCRIHRMASKHARFDAQGRPRLSRRRLGAGAPSAPPVPTARRSTASAASSWQKLISKPASFVSIWHEAEPIYETRSGNSVVSFYLPFSSGARATPRNASTARAERIVTNVSR
jgi:hypothetical protein